MPTVGLTGNFGMGKSTALRLFNELGVFTYDVDGFVHDILEYPGIIKRIAKALGRHAALVMFESTLLFEAGCEENIAVFMLVIQDNFVISCNMNLSCKKEQT
ncbi:MAG TPA: dephospho-CoA kinase [Nitrospirae bacterium]|nr:dephospho-CoA kinase [Nitrospirota bacterium]